MKNIIIIIFAFIFTGCSWYVRYPSVGVGAKIKTRTEVRTVCRWKQIRPNVRVKRCKKIKVIVR